MDDLKEELKKAWSNYPAGPLSDGCWNTVADRARELLAKPVATREEVEAYLTKRDGYVPSMERVASHLAALSHFSPPARPRMMIETQTVGQTAGDLVRASKPPPNGSPLRWETWLRVAEEVHRLATTPAPAVDPDAEAKRLAWEYHQLQTQGHHPKDDTPENLWQRMLPNNQKGWRAVAAAKKEAGGE